MSSQEASKMTIETNNVIVETKGLSESQVSGKKPRLKLVPVLIPVIEEGDSNSDDQTEIILPDVGSVTLETPKNLDDITAYKTLTDPDSDFKAINVLHESPVENSASSSLRMSPESNSFYLMSKSGLSKSKVTLPPRMTLSNFSPTYQASSSKSQNPNVSSVSRSKSKKSEFRKILPKPTTKEINLPSDSQNRATESFNKRFMKILPNSSGELNSFPSYFSPKNVQVERSVLGHIRPKFISKQVNNTPVTLRPIVVNVLAATNEQSKIVETKTTPSKSIRNQISSPEITINKYKNATEDLSLNKSVYEEIERSRHDLSVQVARSYSRKEPVVSKVVAVESGETIGLTDPGILPNKYFVNLSHGTDSNSAVISNFPLKLSKDVPRDQMLIDCPLCVYKVTSKGKLKKHMKIHHLIDKMEKFPSYIEILKKKMNLQNFTGEEMREHHQGLREILFFKSNKKKTNDVSEAEKRSQPIQKTLLMVSEKDKKNTNDKKSKLIQKTFKTLPKLLPAPEKDNSRSRQSKSSQTLNPLRRISTTFLNRRRKILPLPLNTVKKNIKICSNDPVLLNLSKRLGISKALSKNKAIRSAVKTPLQAAVSISTPKDKLPEILNNDIESQDVGFESEKSKEFETDYSASDNTDSECGDQTATQVEKPPKPKYADLTPDTYFCNRCYFVTKDIKDFALHREGHNPPLSCPYCRIITYGRVQLKLHMQSVHDTNVKWNAQNDLILSKDEESAKETTEPVVIKETDYKRAPDFIEIEYHCQACGFYSVNYSEYLEHVKADHVKICNCGNCGKAFNHELKMVEHLKFCTLDDKHKHTSEKTHRNDSGPYSCYICFDVFDEKKGYISHLAKKHNALRYFCVFCNVGFYKRPELKEHYKGNHLLGCRRCKIEFDNTTKLYAHRRTHENNQRFVCEECGKVMKNRAYFKDHLNFHRGIKTHVCKFCGDKFSIYDALTLHRQRKHADQITSSFLCNFCGIQFKFKNRLYQHVRVVHENKTPRQLQYNSVTGKIRAMRRVRDPRTGNLVDRTELLNSNIRPTRRVKDPLTGKYVLKLNHPSEPIKSNKRKRMFLCRHCGMGFSRIAEVREHKEIHELVSNFRCNDCGLYFLSRSNLNTHIETRYCSIFGEKKRVRPPKKKVKSIQDTSVDENQATSIQNTKILEPNSSIIRVHVGSIDVSTKNLKPVDSQPKEASTSRYTSTPTIIRHIKSPRKTFLASLPIEGSKQTSTAILDNEIAFAVDSVLESQNINIANNATNDNNLQTGPETVSNYIIVSEANDEEFPALNFYTEFG